jgi:large subunit ribosomal protein L10e
MGIRPARAIRDPDKRPFTRFSRSNPRQSKIKSMPHRDLHQFRMGTKKDNFDAVFHLRSTRAVILRDNSIESARLAANKYLEKNLLGNFYFIVRVFPHHVIRENKMIAGAGADRLQKGMRRSYGRPSDLAARLNQGTDLFTVYTYAPHEDIVKIAFERARRKLSGDYKIVSN